MLMAKVASISVVRSMHRDSTANLLSNPGAGCGGFGGNLLPAAAGVFRNLLGKR